MSMNRKTYICLPICYKLKLGSFKSSEHINEKWDGPYSGFDYSSLASNPVDLATWSQREFLKFCNFQQGSRYKVEYYLNVAKYIKHWLEN